MEGPKTTTDVAGLAHQWATILQAIPDLLIILSADGYVEFISPSSAKLLGLEPDYIVGHRACEFIPPEDRRNCVRWLAHARTTPDLPELAHHLVHRDGTVRSFESSLRLMPDVGSRVVIVSRNVSERDVVDQQLAAMAEMWTDIFNVVREGVLVVNAQSVVVSANRSVLESLESTSATMIGRLITDFVRPAYGSDPGADDLLTYLGHSEQRRRIELVTSTGELRPARGYAMRLAHAGTNASSGDTAVVIDLERSAATGRGAVEPGSPPEVSLEKLLSPREIEVLRLLTQGLDVRAVSSRLGISIHTTRNYVKSVLHKLDVRTQLQAVVVALRYGLLDL